MYRKNDLYRTRSSGAAPLFVLMFHGLVERFPPYATFHETRTCQLKVSDFEKTLEWCAQRYRFIRQADLPEYLTGEATEPGVMLTFDDGMSSVCDLAVPVLLRYGAAATLFVTTDWIDRGTVPPIFELEKELWERAPVRLHVRAGDFTFAAEARSRTATGTVIADLWAALFSHRRAPLSLRKSEFSFDGQSWGESSSSVDALWQPASWESLRSAVASRALEIGAHGVTHTPWTWLDSAALDDELVISKARLEAEFGTAIDTCAYPHGLNDASVRQKAANVFQFTFGSASGPTTPCVDVANIPRYHVPSEWPNGLWSLISKPVLGRVLRRGARLVRISR